MVTLELDGMKSHGPSRCFPHLKSRLSSRCHLTFLLNWLTDLATTLLICRLEDSEVHLSQDELLAQELSEGQTFQQNLSSWFGSFEVSRPPRYWDWNLAWGLSFLVMFQSLRKQLVHYAVEPCRGSSLPQQSLKGELPCLIHHLVFLFGLSSILPLAKSKINAALCLLWLWGKSSGLVGITWLGTWAE